MIDSESDVATATATTSIVCDCEIARDVLQYIVKVSSLL